MLLAILANDLKMLLIVVVSGGLTDGILAWLVVLASQRSALQVVLVAVLMRLLNVIAGLRLARDAARADLRRWIALLMRFFKVPSCATVGHDVLLVKHSRGNRRVVLARNGNVAAVMLPNAWMRLLTRCWKVVSLLIGGGVVKRLAVVVSRLKFNEQLLLVATVVRLDLRLLLVRLSDRLVAVGLVLMLVSRGLIVASEQMPLLLMKASRIKIGGGLVCVTLLSIRKTFVSTLLNVNGEGMPVRVI
jgi:hypothetical protein